MLGCGLPGGEQGFNMGRVVAVLLGYDDLPGCTITRYCSSSLQTTRMALHAIKAGEGDVFISAGVETVSPLRQGQLRLAGRTPTTRCSPTPRRGTAQPPPRAAAAGTTRARTARCPDVYIAMGQTAENLARPRASPARSMDEFGVRSQNLAEKAIADGFWASEITPVTLPDGTVV